MPLFHRWYRDDAGQDVIEYALLTSFVAFGAIVGLSLLREAIGDSYAVWDANTQSDMLVEVPDPAGAP